MRSAWRFMELLAVIAAPLLLWWRDDKTGAVACLVAAVYAAIKADASR